MTVQVDTAEPDVVTDVPNLADVLLVDLLTLPDSTLARVIRRLFDPTTRNTSTVSGFGSSL